jgi:hypothetical protein
MIPDAALSQLKALSERMAQIYDLRKQIDEGEAQLCSLDNGRVPGSPLPAKFEEIYFLLEDLEDKLKSLERLPIEGAS